MLKPYLASLILGAGLLVHAAYLAGRPRPGLWLGAALAAAFGLAGTGATLAGLAKRDALAGALGAGVLGAGALAIAARRIGGRRLPQDLTPDELLGSVAEVATVLAGAAVGRVRVPIRGRSIELPAVLHSPAATPLEAGRRVRVIELADGLLRVEPLEREGTGP